MKSPAQINVNDIVRVDNEFGSFAKGTFYTIKEYNKPDGFCLLSEVKPPETSPVITIESLSDNFSAWTKIDHVTAFDCKEGCVVVNNKGKSPSHKIFIINKRQNYACDLIDLSNTKSYTIEFCEIIKNFSVYKSIFSKNEVAKPKTTIIPVTSVKPYDAYDFTDDLKYGSILRIDHGFQNYQDWFKSNNLFEVLNASKYNLTISYLNTIYEIPKHVVRRNCSLEGQSSVNVEIFKCDALDLSSNCEIKVINLEPNKSLSYHHNYKVKHDFYVNGKHLTRGMVLHITGYSTETKEYIARTLYGKDYFIIDENKFNYLDYSSY